MGEAAKAKTTAAEEGDRRFNKVKVSNARKGSKVIQVQVHYMTAAGGVVVGCDLGTAMAVSDCICLFECKTLNAASRVAASMSRGPARDPMLPDMRNCA